MSKMKDSDIWFLNKIKIAIRDFSVSYKQKHVIDISLDRKRIGNKKYKIKLEDKNGKISEKWISPTEMIYNFETVEKDNESNS